MVNSQVYRDIIAYSYLQARGSLEDKNNTLQDTIGRLREEVRNSENRRSNLEQDIRRLNQEQNDLIRKLSIAEASLDVAQKVKIFLHLIIYWRCPFLA